MVAAANTKGRRAVHAGSLIVVARQARQAEVALPLGDMRRPRGAGQQTE